MVTIQIKIKKIMNLNPIELQIHVYVIDIHIFIKQINQINKIN